jgi:hypothetical protein
MNVSQAKSPLGSGLSQHRSTGQPSKQNFEIETPIETILELGQISRGIFPKFDRMIGAGKGGFQVAQQRVDPTKFRMLCR